MTPEPVDTASISCEHARVTRMGTANLLTSSRFVMSPLFAVAFWLTGAYPSFAIAGVATLWVIYSLIELSDVLDGAVARSQNTVSDIGKILDPFADVVSKVTYFACLMSSGLVPLWFLLVVLYREFGIILIRMLLYRTGIALGARLAGKLKTWLYAIAAATGLLLFSVDSLRQAGAVTAAWRDAPWVSVAFTALLVGAALLAVGSFMQYFTLFIRERRRATDGADR